MNQDNKQHIAIADIEFAPIGDKELNIITFTRNRRLFSAFVHRIYISVIVTIIVMVMEFIGRSNPRYEKTIPGSLAFIFIAFIVFNLLSYGYMTLKKQMDIYRDHLSFVYGTITEKYDNHTLSKQNNQKSKNYVLFDTENVHCITAIAVAGSAEFKDIKPGDNVLVVKSSSYGDNHYELYTQLNI